MKHLTIGLLCILSTLSFALDKQGLEKKSGYNAQTDTLNLYVVDVPLKDVLKGLAFQSGLSIKLDERVQHSTTANYTNVSLDEAVTRLAKGLNIAKKYTQTKAADGTQKDVLTEVIIVAKGNETAPILLDMMNAETEAKFYGNAKANQLNEKHQQRADKRLERWNARVGNMVEDKKKKIVAIEQERLNKAIKQEETRQERKAERSKKREEREERKKSKSNQNDKRLEYIKENNPEQYQEIMGKKQRAENK